MDEIEKLKKENELLKKQNQELREMAQRAGSLEAHYQHRCYQLEEQVMRLQSK